MPEYLVTMVVDAPDGYGQSGVRRVIRSRVETQDQHPFNVRGYTVDKSKGGFIELSEVACPGCGQLKVEVKRLTCLIDTPHTDDFLQAVPMEAAHQLKRWGVEHDDGKEPQDWFWLVGFLVGKCLRAAIDGDTEKAMHHTISTAAVMLNWYRRLTGDDETFRPGIANPERINSNTGAA